MDFMIPYGVLLYQSSAESLRCLPVFAVRRGCVVRIAYECFLDYNLLEVLCFQDGEQHLSISLRFQYHSLQPLLGRTACPPILEDALPFCPFGTFPHTVGNYPPPPS